MAVEDLLPSVVLHVAKWLLCGKEFKAVKNDDNIRNWDAGVVCGPSAGKKFVGDLSTLAS